MDKSIIYCFFHRTLSLSPSFEKQAKMFVSFFFMLKLTILRATQCSFNNNNNNNNNRKIVCENGGKHPLSSTAIMYLAREKGGRGLRSVEREYKLTKIKAAMKLLSEHGSLDEDSATVRKEGGREGTHVDDEGSA